MLSFVFSAVVVGMWYTDFGRAPAALEGKLAEATLERALEHASRTGTFVARMDDEVFKSLAPDQLEAIADRAWRRRKRNAPDLADDDHAVTHEDYSSLLRLRTASSRPLRDAVEPEFPNLFRRWRFGDVLHEADGLHVVEYAVELGSTVTPGVVSDTLRSRGGASPRTTGAPMTRSIRRASLAARVRRSAMVAPRGAAQRLFRTDSALTVTITTQLGPLLQAARQPRTGQASGGVLVHRRRRQARERAGQAPRARSFPAAGAELRLSAALARREVVRRQADAARPA